MLVYIGQRLALALLTVWVISVVSFVIIQLPPGDYVTAYVAELQSMGTVVTRDEAENLRAQYGLGEPLPVQYYKWIRLIVRGDFGVSMEYGRPVSEVIGDRLALTVAVSFAAVTFTWIIAIPIGIYSGVRQYSLVDYGFTLIGFLGLAIPNFLFALVVMYVGFVWFGANLGGLFSPEYARAPYSIGKVWDLLKHLWIPAVILGFSGMAQLMRIMRANLLDELPKPYVVTARAKGLAEWKVVLKYPVRVALNPLISILGYVLPQIVAGSIVVSVVMSLPTVGPLLLKALVAQDMFLAGTIILLVSVMTVVGTLISDLLLAWVDPRISLEAK